MKEDEREGRGGCNSPGKACRRCTIRDSRVPKGSQVQYSTVQYSTVQYSTVQAKMKISRKERKRSENIR